MHPFTRCPTCGRLVSPYYTLYHTRNQSKLNELAEKGILPEYARVNTTIGVHSNEIFDDLGISTICCRLTIKTGTYFRMDVYGHISAQPQETPRASKFIMRPKN